ncbi:MAG: helix-turn-helix transcriptional regulator [Clostridia bacterium]|nr:helix-turn-helix transcriptional regulator [Clostridia bacterium]
MPNNLKYYREAKNLTQEELSKKAEVSRNTISLIETGANTNITYNVMEKLAKALDMTVEEIFFKKLAQNIVQK